MTAHTVEYVRYRVLFAEIRPYVENIEEMRHYEPTAVRGTGSAVPTLYDWAGGHMVARHAGKHITSPSAAGG
ncbi:MULTISPECIES: hypothetical protein [unclassified Streptomyces]|uniref:hypothetical protein n=1 Tax=unclassified Streptomyces TaxID=2593676 RepID=UPI0033A210FE